MIRFETRCSAREITISLISALSPAPNQPPMSFPVSTSMMLPVRMDGNRLATEEITMHTSTSASWRQ